MLDNAVRDRYRNRFKSKWPNNYLLYKAGGYSAIYAFYLIIGIVCKSVLVLVSAILPVSLTCLVLSLNHFCRTI